MKRVVVTAGPVSGSASGLPTMAEPTVPEAVTVTVFPAPRLETRLPYSSVISTPVLNVPRLPSAVTVQVKKQGEPTVPALAIGVLRATRLAAPIETVNAKGE